MSTEVDNRDDDRNFLETIRDGDSLKVRQLTRSPFSGHGLRTWAIHPTRLAPWAGLLYGGLMAFGFFGTLITGRPAQIRSIAELVSPLTLGALLASPFRSAVISVDQNVVVPMDKGFGNGNINWAQPQQPGDSSLIVPPADRSLGQPVPGR